MRTLVIFLAMAGCACTVSAQTIWLTADTNMPDPNQEVTVYVHTDTPLFIMEVWAQVIGDANLTAAMNPADCNQYGWDPGWALGSYFDSDGWVYNGGIRWASDANGTVGYFKFRYHSGCVTVSIDDQWSDAFSIDWQTHSSSAVEISTDTLTFGTCEPNQQQMMGGGQIEGDSNDQRDANIVALPPLVPADPNRHKPQLLRCPANIAMDSNSRLQSARAFFPMNARFSPIEDLTQRNRVMTESESEPNVIEVYEDITTNTVWTANNIYYVETAINVQALLVIEPGTLVIYGSWFYSTDGSMTVKNGGTLIAKGTPDKPIIHTPDWMLFTNPEYIGCYYYAYPDIGPLYDYPVYVERSASPATTIAYNFVEGAVCGIVTDGIRLDHPIENNYFFANRYGVLEYGPYHTDIKNNLCFFSEYSGIEIGLADANGVADANDSFIIENNTCDTYQQDGIYIQGVMDANQAGSVTLINNIVSESYSYGLHLCDPCEYVQAIVYNTGYYGNATNMSWEGFPNEYNPVEVNDMPYAYSQITYWHDAAYLNQSCPFINAGRDYIEQTPLIGMTTDINSIPDSNKVDIGFHYPNWSYANAGTGLAASDFNKDSITDYKDLYTLASNWLSSVTAGTNGDLNNDANVTFIDFALFAQNWQKIQGEPNIVPTISGDPNTGYIDVGVGGYNSNTKRVFLLKDGQYVGEMFQLVTGYPITIDISESGNQDQHLKLATIGKNGHITCSDIKGFSFTSSLNYCILPEGYEPNQPMYFAAYNNDTEDVNVTVLADGGISVWSQTYSGNNVFGAIPAEITSQHDLDCVVLSASIGKPPIRKPAPPDTKNKKADPTVQALLILPDAGINTTDIATIYQVERAFIQTGVKAKRLEGDAANWAQLVAYAATHNVRYLYVAAHANYWLNNHNELRTWVLLHDGPIVSIKRSDFPDQNQAPSWCQPLDGDIENTWGFSFYTMGFDSLEFACFDCCYSGHLMISGNQLIEGTDGPSLVLNVHSDMSVALCAQDTSWNFAYQGWDANSITGLRSTFSKFMQDEWCKLSLGRGVESLYTSLQYAIGRSEYDPMLYLFPAEEYRLKGYGDATAISLHH
jgi:hypothetical protein